MRKILLLILMLVSFSAALPALVVSNPVLSGPQVEVEGPSPEIRVLNVQTGKVMVLQLEDYLVGVVAAEMPSSFHDEALKAQAVASRTYALNKMHRKASVGDLHPQADVCTDHTHCQAWISSDEMVDRWGVTVAFNVRNKVLAAVQATRGEVVDYQGQLIDPVYHSTSNGRTEDSEDVWEYTMPYLRGVSSPWDKESPKFHSQTIFSLAEVDARLGTSLHALPASTLAQPGTIKIETRTPTGRAKEVDVGGKEMTAGDLRQKLDLPSTDFSWQISGDKITFSTTGYGHGVGMSQYGAEGMAADGYDYAAILKHYYTGVQLQKIY